MFSLILFTDRNSETSAVVPSEHIRLTRNGLKKEVKCGCNWLAVNVLRTSDSEGDLKGLTILRSGKVLDPHSSVQCASTSFNHSIQEQAPVTRLASGTSAEVMSDSRNEVPRIDDTVSDVSSLDPDRFLDGMKMVPDTSIEAGDESSCTDVSIDDDLISLSVSSLELSSSLTCSKDSPGQDSCVIDTHKKTIDEAENFPNNSEISMEDSGHPEIPKISSESLNALLAQYNKPVFLSEFHILYHDKLGAFSTQVQSGKNDIPFVVDDNCILADGRTGSINHKNQPNSTVEIEGPDNTTQSAASASDHMVPSSQVSDSSFTVENQCGHDVDSPLSKNTINIFTTSPLQKFEKDSPLIINPNERAENPMIKIYNGLAAGTHSRNNNPTLRNSSLHSHALESFSNNQMVELMPRSGVMINKFKLDQLIEHYGNDSSALMRELFLTLVGRSQLLKMTVTGKGIGHKPIPPLILETIEAYIAQHTMNELPHNVFRRRVVQMLHGFRIRQ